MANNQDLRIQRTRKSLNLALLTLMEEKEFAAITIQDLANEAMINRATFYLHYSDKYALLEKCAKDYLDEMMLKHVTPVRHIRNGVVYPEVFYRIVTEALHNVESNKQFFQVMFQSNCEQLIKDYFIQIVQTKLLPEIGDVFVEIQTDRYKEITVQLIVSAVLGVINWWIMSEKRETPEEIAGIVVDVITKGPAYMLGLKTNEV